MTLENKASSIEAKMEELRLINRAKWLLIDNLKRTEADAHRYIEKQAMDRRVNRREIALMSLKHTPEKAFAAHFPRRCAAKALL